MRTSARRGAREWEERWGKAAKRGAAKAGHERRRWGREERTPKDGQRGGGRRTGHQVRMGESSVANT